MKRTVFSVFSALAVSMAASVSVAVADKGGNGPPGPAGNPSGSKPPAQPTPAGPKPAKRGPGHPKSGKPTSTG